MEIFFSCEQENCLSSIQGDLSSTNNDIILFWSPEPSKADDCHVTNKHLEIRNSQKFVPYSNISQRTHARNLQ